MRGEMWKIQLLQWRGQTNDIGAVVYGVTIGVHESLAAEIHNYLITFVLTGSRVVELRINSQLGHDLIVVSAHRPSEPSEEKDKTEL